MQCAYFAKSVSETICSNIFCWEWCSEVCYRHCQGLTTNLHDGSLQMSSDTWFVADIYTTVKLQAALSTAPVYLYQFSFDGEFGFLKRIVGASRFPGESVISEPNSRHFKIQISLPAQDLLNTGSKPVHVFLSCSVKKKEARRVPKKSDAEHKVIIFPGI